MNAELIRADDENDHRIRHAADAEVGLHSFRLLGMLPTLPDDLTDPEQVALAAYAVHHIRILLQISSPKPWEEGRVLVIAGSEAGSGKTSLTTVWGLVFSVCGSWTLVTDANIVGAGLTRRFNNKSDIGRLDAYDGADISGCISPTKTRNLGLLSVGTAQPHDANTLSPYHLQRIIMDAARSYDRVLSDTDPVSGGLEASIAASLAEETMMVCS